MISAKRVSTRKRLRRAVLTLALIALPAAALPTTAAAAPPGAVWKISTKVVTPTNFTAGDNSGNSIYAIYATNVGSQAASGTITIADELPEGLSLHEKSSVGGYPRYLQMFDDGQG